MSEFQFIGSTKKNILWNRVNVPTSCTQSCGQGNNPPLPFNPNTALSIRSYIPFDDTISWQGNVPNQLEGLTINQILKFSNIKLNISLVVIVEQGSLGDTISNSTPNINVSLYPPGNLNPYYASPQIQPIFNTNISALTPTDDRDCSACIDYCLSPTNCPKFITNVEINSDIGLVQIIPWNFDTQVATFNYGVTNLTLSAQVNITAQLNCSGINLESEICSNYCFLPDNRSNCLAEYQEYCLTEVSEEPVITTSKNCRDFLSVYIQKVNPLPKVDRALEKYCQKNLGGKYEGFEDLLASNNQVDIDLCACHLQDSIYQNLRNELIKLYSGFGAISENERCLFPECVDSPFKSVSTGSICVLPNCVNISSITNNGTIDGPVTVTQNTGCANVTGGGGGGGGGIENAKSWIEKHWVWVVLGISLLVVLIIVILIVIASETNKKKKI